MPELPEVETTARGLQARLAGHRITGVWVGWERTLANVDSGTIGRVLVGDTIRDVGRRGKFVQINLVSSAILLVHRRMTGNLLVRTVGEPRDSYTRFALDFAGGLALWFVDVRKLGRVWYGRDADEARAYLDRIAGPEPLEAAEPGHLAARLKARRRRLKALLLDQRFLAGIGNLYADEILWTARLHPERVASSLSPDEAAALDDAIRRILTDAIERRGTSFDDYLDAEGEPGGNEPFLEAYGRAGQPCSRCGTLVQKYSLGQRGTHYCPTCQPAPSAPADQSNSGEVGAGAARS